jgi:hypothetical protein
MGELFYENLMFVSPEMKFGTFVKFLYSYTFCWIDWYTASENRSNSLKVVHQGVLA